MLFEEAVAAAVEGCNVETPDAVSGVCPWEEMWCCADGGWERWAFPLGTPGWRFDESYQMWMGPADSAQEVVR